MGQLRQKIRCRGCHQHKVGPAGQFDMAHGRLGRAIPQLRAHLAARHGLEGQRRHKLAGARGHHHLDLRPALYEATYQIGALVGGDAAGDTQHDAFSVHRTTIGPEDQRFP